MVLGWLKIPIGRYTTNPNMTTIVSSRSLDIMTENHTEWYLNMNKKNFDLYSNSKITFSNLIDYFNFKIESVW